MPETGQQHEIGVRYQPPGANAYFVTAAFDLVRQNLATRDPQNPLFNVQTDEVRSRGLELEATTSPTPFWNLQAACTHLSEVAYTKDNTGLEGRRRYGTPRHRLSVWSDYRIGEGVLSGLGFGGGVRYIGDSWGDNQNTFRVAGATSIDALVYYDRDAKRLSVNAIDLDDERYTPCTGSAASCNLGEGHRITASLSQCW